MTLVEPSERLILACTTKVYVGATHMLLPVWALVLLRAIILNTRVFAELDTALLHSSVVLQNTHEKEP